MEEDLANQAPERWLNRGVAGIGLASFFSDVSHEIATSLLPSLLTRTLKSSASALGFIEGVADGVSGISKLAGGALADDPVRRRRIAVGGYAVTAVFTSLLGSARTALQVGVLRSAAWAARGIRGPARNALLADIVPTDHYGRAYGFERAMDNLGAIVGPLLAILLVGLTSVRTAIQISIVPGLLAALAILYAARQVRKTAAPVRPHEPVRLRLREVLSGRLGRLMSGIAAFEFGNVTATLLILRATTLLEPGMGDRRAAQLAIGLYVLYNAAATLASFPAGQLADRRGTGPVLSFGVSLFALAYLGFAIGGGSVIALAPWFLAAGIGIGCVETSENAAVAALAPDHIRSSAFGVLATVQSLGNLAASSIVGLLWSNFNPGASFLYLVACMAVSVVAIRLTGRRLSKPPKI